MLVYYFRNDVTWQSFQEWFCSIGLSAWFYPIPSQPNDTCILCHRRLEQDADASEQDQDQSISSPSSVIEGYHGLIIKSPSRQVMDGDLSATGAEPKSHVSGSSKSKGDKNSSNTNCSRSRVREMNLLCKDPACIAKRNEGEDFEKHVHRLNRERRTRFRHASFVFTGFLIFTVLMLLYRISVGVFGYSGQGKPPMYGDFEAQRHWMEITVNLPAKDWYEQTEDNDLQYWGLDYPPLSAYWAWIWGKIAQAVPMLAPLVELHTSRGYESDVTKRYMRWTVIFSDLMFYLPAACLAASVMYRRYRFATQVLVMIQLALNPVLVLIDHGHFQYNGVSIGLMLYALYALARKRHFQAAALYTCCILFKQTGLYYSLAFFFYMLGAAYQDAKQKVEAEKSKSKCRVFALFMGRVVLLALTVIATCAAVFAPIVLFSGSPNPLATFKQILHRMFPVARGLFEDKVANFWCATHVLIKWKSLFANAQLFRFATVATLVGALPSCIDVALRPSFKRFVYSLVSVSLSFFLFSYQVHEKSIIFAFTPLLLLVIYHPMIVLFCVRVGVLSLYPLLRRDGLGIMTWFASALAGNSFKLATFLENYVSRPFSYLPPPIFKLVPRSVRDYLGLTCEHAPTYPNATPRQDMSPEAMRKFQLTIGLVVLAYHFMPVPARYPDLPDTLIACYSFVVFFVAYIFFLYFQLFVLSERSNADVQPNGKNSPPTKESSPASGAVTHSFQRTDDADQLINEQSGVVSRRRTIATSHRTPQTRVQLISSSLASPSATTLPTSRVSQAGGRIADQAFDDKTQLLPTPQPTRLRGTTRSPQRVRTPGDAQSKLSLSIQEGLSPQVARACDNAVIPRVYDGRADPQPE